MIAPEQNSELPNPQNTASASWRRDLTWLALILVAWFGLFLGSRPLSNPDEGRYTEIPREMAATNDYVTPRLNGVKYFEKPPLLYWLTALTIEVAGVNEWTARAWVAIFATLGCLATYAAARGLFGRAAGWWAAVVLATMLLYYTLSRVVILDMPVSVFVATALFAFLFGIRTPAGPGRRWLFWAFYASMALAVLSKGLIGFLLPCTVAFVWLLVFNQWKRLRPCHPFTGALVLLAIAAPWHVLAARANADFAQFYFIHEHWTRFTTTVHERYQPWWYFAPVLLVGIFPWTVFAFQTLRENARGGWRAIRNERADEWFFIVWAVVIFLFFSKSQSKLPPYILPIFPALAVLIGKWLADAWRARTAPGLRAGLAVYAIFSALLGLALALWPLVWSVPEKHAAATKLIIGESIWFAVIFLGSAAALAWCLRRGKMRRALVVMTAGFALWLASGNHLGDELDTRSTKSLSLELARRLAPGDTVYSVGEYIQDVAPYTGRTINVAIDFDPTADDDPFGELTFGVRAEPEKAASRFIDKAEFTRRWFAESRAYAFVQKRKADRYFSSLPHTVVGETSRYLLLVNKPAAH
ncbi:4-amino-4-deoxy-L-arabinose transferase-like glycosyltransferase [Ereboglobus sp. PH5-5]|uniref:glycosyltransferase family 39 protein n=1 Tax=Ereboglobus sp. PH5-5 TaxID=2940529 RepID=UPI00240601F8|nr:glycosyltransferase family 39 protein [Ereboglobus sp. PH5-5]MDF9834012.1 4-amino-4-deoxy-L-arabinose transferase-like glycosyltransferase [Ereboglobus sp. PH5-5]